MDQGRLSFSSLLCALTCFAAIGLATPAAAGPPKIGDGGGSWTDNLWPSFESWKLPSLSSKTAPAKAKASKASQPGFAETTRAGLSRTWKSVQRGTRSAWESTKHALRPYDPPQKSRKTAQRESSGGGGFWSSLFGGGSQPQSQLTVNDFLKQPMPQ